MKKISIILPTLNEAETIEKVIDSIPKEILYKLGYDIEVLVVDGGSTDGTQWKALKKGARVLIVRKRGYGLAYLIGFKYARGEYIVTLDADMTYPPRCIPLLLLALERYGLDFISTNRFKFYEAGAFNKPRLIGNKIINVLTFILFGVRIKDTQSGMWCFRKDILNRLKLKCWGMDFSTEIKLEAFKKAKAGEISIYYLKRRKGSSKIKLLKDGLRIVLFLIKKRILTLVGL